METEKEKEFKLSIRVTPEYYAYFRGIAKKYGLTLNQLGNMSIQAGIKSIIRAISPEEAFTPEQLVAILKEAERQGLNLDVSAITKHDG